MNESPFDMIRQKRLRDDLFYRLEIGMVVIPPLRERKMKLFLWLAILWPNTGANSNKDVYPFLASVEKQLLDYDWPGNVRMLENVIVRVSYFKTPGPLTELFFNHETDVITHFSAEASSQSASLVETYRENLTVEEGTLTDKLEQYEYQILIEALKSSWVRG